MPLLDTATTPPIAPFVCFVSALVPRGLRKGCCSSCSRLVLTQPTTLPSCSSSTSMTVPHSALIVCSLCSIDTASSRPALRGSPRVDRCSAYDDDSVDSSLRGEGAADSLAADSAVSGVRGEGGAEPARPIGGTYRRLELAGSEETR